MVVEIERWRKRQGLSIGYVYNVYNIFMVLYATQCYRRPPRYIQLDPCGLLRELASLIIRTTTATQYKTRTSNKQMKSR